MTPAELGEAVLAAATRVFVRRGLDDHLLPPRADLRRSARPGPDEHGPGDDYTSHLALRVAGRAGLAPRQLADALADELRAVHGVAAVRVSGAGHLDIRLAAAGPLAARVVRAGRGYGRDTHLAGQVVTLGPVEPEADLLTAPLSRARRALLRAAVGRLLLACGARVTAEPGAEHVPRAEAEAEREHVPRADAESRAGDRPPPTLGELVDAMGSDAARYAVLRQPLDAPLAVDVDGWTRASPRNPIYLVRYAAARTAFVTRNAADLGLVRGHPVTHPPPGPEPDEAALLAMIAAYPDVVHVAARRREPHRVARYLEELADSYLRFHESRRILPRGDEPIGDGHRAALWINDATRTVFGNGLGLLGVAAPERL